MYFFYQSKKRCLSSCQSCIINCSGRPISCTVCFPSLVSTPFLLLPLLWLLQLQRGTFLLLLQAAQRVRVALFPFPLFSSPLSALPADSLLLFQAADALLLGRAHQFPQLNGLHVVQ